MIAYVCHNTSCRVVEYWGDPSGLPLSSCPSCLMLGAQRVRRSEDRPPTVAESILDAINEVTCPNDHGPDGIIACWSPGGPCPEGQTVCESCGPCTSCSVVVDVKDPPVYRPELIQLQFEAGEAP